MLKIIISLFIFSIISYAGYRILNNFKIRNIPPVKQLNLNQTKRVSSMAVFLISYFLIQKLIICIPLMIAGFFLPGFYVNYRNKQKLSAFNNGLIEVINILINSLRAGNSLFQSLEIVTQNSKPPVSTEFQKMVSEIKLGIPIEQSLINLTSRIKSNDLEMFVTTINIARQTGGSLPEILTTISETIVERNKIQGKISALTAQGKMSGLIVSSMPFILMIILYIMSPELMEPMFNTVLGQVMITCILVLVAAGGFIIYKIVDIDI